jgi:hypothetical protein
MNYTIYLISGIDLPDSVRREKINRSAKPIIYKYLEDGTRNNIILFVDPIRDFYLNPRTIISRDLKDYDKEWLESQEDKNLYNWFYKIYHDLCELITDLYTEYPEYRIGTKEDKYLINLSKSNKKEIIELESVESQLEVYTKAPDITFDAQFKMLRDETRESYHKQINQLYDAWVTGDTDTVYKLSAGGTDADYAKAGLTAEEIAAVKKFNSSIKGDRNIKMAEKLEKLLKEGKKAFVMIGAAHFLGDDSIISLLEAKGYKAKRI